MGRLRSFAGRNLFADRLVCHGGPGFIGFSVQNELSSEIMNWGNIPTIFGGRDYRHVFPTYIRVHYVGCECAATDMGWLFLEATARNLCTNQGGLAFAWTSKGYFWPWSDHCRHFSGDCRYVDSGPGGAIQDLFTAVEMTTKLMDMNFSSLMTAEGTSAFQRRWNLMEDN
jgi:hypothetical protein